QVEQRVLAGRAAQDGPDLLGGDRDGGGLALGAVQHAGDEPPGAQAPVDVLPGLGPGFGRDHDLRHVLTAPLRSLVSLALNGAYTKRLVTEASSWMLRMAFPNSSAMERTTIFSQRRFSGVRGIESVTISLESGLFWIISMALPDSTACDELASTSRAPASCRAWATLARVPPVSTMSSTMRAVRPSTSP